MEIMILDECFVYTLLTIQKPLYLQKLTPMYKES